MGSSTLPRRAWLAALASAATSAACSRSSADDKTPPSTAGWNDVPFPASEDQPDGQLASIYAPSGSRGWPLLVALHGRGEAGRGLDAGAHGWRDDYALDARRARLEAPPLVAADADGMLESERLEALNASLAKTPWRGLAIACPYTPVPTGRDLASARPFMRFVTDSLLAKAAEKVGPLTRERTGIDGVSMGGRYALQIGFSCPEIFGAVGAMQPAIREEEAVDFADLARAAKKKRLQIVRLVTSADDPFLDATRALSKALTGRAVDHQLIVTQGPHDYAWNRGPGGIEMLAFHERVLRGVAPP